MSRNSSKDKTDIELVYEKLIGVMLDFNELKGLQESVHPDFIGYGSAAHEFFRTREDLKKMARIQKEQLEGQEFTYNRKPVAQKFLTDGESCLILEEFDLHFSNNNHHLLLRLSTLLERINGVWLVTHVHGSTPDANIAEEEAFPEQGLRRKNEELEAKIRERTRELELEAALERVRAKTMAMHQSEELQMVIQEVYDQFAYLGLKVDHTGFLLDYKERDDMHIWLADPNGVPVEIFIPYFDSPHWNSFLTARKNGEDLFVNQLDFKTKNKFYKDLFKWIPGIPEASREIYFNCPGLTISTVLIDSVGLYIENFSGTPYTQNENEILMRFGKVFQQAYTRFLDLKKAETQAREAQIEAALERLRSRTRAMQKTEEISDVTVVFLEQLKELELNFVQAWINVFHLEEGYYDIWFSPLEGVYNEPAHLQLPSALFEDTSFKSWKAGNRFSYISLNSKEEVDALVKACDQASGTTYFTHFQEVLNLKRLEFVDANYKYGTISKSGREKATKEEEEILYRFARVFEQTYTRFLDLQKAETRAKEAQIEAALERVRSRAMAMQSSEELKDVAYELRKQLGSLDIRELETCVIILYEGSAEYVTSWSASKSPNTDSGFVISEVRFPKKGVSALEEIIERYENKKMDYVVFNDPAKLSEFFQFLKEYDPKTYDVVRETNRNIKPSDLQSYWTVSDFKGGSLLITTSTMPEEHTRKLLRRFANVFGLSYQRFSDLKQAEAQARKAQIETALERVRSRTMAMQHSDELAEASHLLDKEVRGLGIKTWGCAFNIYQKNDSIEWFGNEAGLLPTYTVPRKGIFKEYYERGQKGESLYIKEIAGEVCIAHYEYMSTLPVVGDVLKQLKETNGSFPSYQIDHVVYFKYGYLLFITREAVPEAHDIFKQFARVFEQTYTRFLDLQLKEEQAVKLVQEKQRLEKTLADLQATQQQLVHAEKMASLGELTAGIAHEIKNPLNFVNNFSDVTRELVKEMIEEVKKGEMEEADSIAQDIVQNLDKIVDHGQRADSIVRGMLQHSRSGNGKKEPTDLNALADEYLRLAYHGLRAKDKSFNADMETDFDPELPKVKVVPQDIGRVLLNLITNAFYAVNERKAQEPDGYKPTVWVKTQKTADGVKLSVRDNGVGIPDKIKDKIFQPFFTTKPTGQGTGLGLSMSYEIVTKGHEGQLSVKSEKDVGTEFLMVLKVT